MQPPASMPPCDQFTILSSRETDRLSRCDVCDLAEDAHPTRGRRKLTGGEIEEIRRRLLIATYDKLEEAQRKKEGNGPT